MGNVEHFYRDVLDYLNDGFYLVDEQRQIVFWNHAAEKVTGFSPEEVVGKSCRENVLRHTNIKGRCLNSDDCPLEMSFRDLRAREQDLYIQHVNGTKILTRIHVSPMKDPSGQTMLAVKFHPAADPSRKRLYETVCAASPNEALPAVTDRASMERGLVTNLDELRRYGWHFGALLVAVDRFDELVERYGYPYSHRVLKMVTETIRSGIRSSDQIGRWDDNCFLVIAMNVDLEGLRLVAERLRVAVAQKQTTFFKEKIFSTISIGAAVAQLEDDVASLTGRCRVLLGKSRYADGNIVFL